MDTGLGGSLIKRNVQGSLPIDTVPCTGLVSSGMFTLGHVWPEAFDELLRISTPGALFAISQGLARSRATRSQSLCLKPFFGLLAGVAVKERLQHPGKNVRRIRHGGKKRGAAAEFHGIDLSEDVLRRLVPMQ